MANQPRIDLGSQIAVGAALYTNSIVVMYLTDDVNHAGAAGITFVAGDLKLHRVGDITTNKNVAMIFELDAVNFPGWYGILAEAFQENESMQWIYKFAKAGYDTMTLLLTYTDTSQFANVFLGNGREGARVLPGMDQLAQAAPDATPTVQEALMLLYMALRNDSQATDTERSIRNDAATKIAKATMSDNGTTFSQGKLGSGA